MSDSEEDATTAPGRRKTTDPPTLRVVQYSPAQQHVHRVVRANGRAEEILFDGEEGIGRPRARQIIERLATTFSIEAASPAEIAPARTPLLDTPGGMLSFDRYRDNDTYVVNNLGNLPRLCLEDYVYKAGARFLFNASPDRLLYRRFFAESLHPTIDTLPLYFDESTFHPGPRLADEGPFRGRKVLFYAGRLSPEKQIHLLIHLAAGINQQVDALLVMTGAFEDDPPSRDYRRFVHDEIARLGMTQQVRFVGHLPSLAQLAALYRRADLLVNATCNHDEAFGLSQIEAMACGTPVLGAAWGGLKDTVPHGRCGYLMDTLVSDHGTFLDLVSGVQFAVDYLSSPDAHPAWRQRCQAEAARYTRAEFCRRFAEIALKRAPPPEVAPIRAEERVASVVRRMLSDGLHARLKDALNPAHDELTMADIYRLRNARRLDEREWRGLSLVDLNQKGKALREHYGYICEGYGATTPARIREELVDATRIVPTAVEIVVDGPNVEVLSPVFGDRRHTLSAAELALLMACRAEAGQTLRELGASGGASADACREVVARLSQLGLVMIATNARID